MRNSIFIAAAMITVIVSPVFALISQATPKIGEIVLVVAPPFGAHIGDILKQASVADIHPDRAPIGAFVLLETQENYADLLENGAWLVLHGEGLLELC